MRSLNSPATLREVLEARNFMARTIIYCANTIFAFLWFTGAAVFAYEVFKQYGEPWAALVFIGALAAWHYWVSIKPGPGLVQSEKYLETSSSLEDA
jgi:hypothetical protein